jgi:hypothetical protein
VVGIDQTVENEGLDRVNVTLPGMQDALVAATCAAAKGACILVLMSGGSQDISAVLPAVSAALYAGFLGGNGAEALVGLLFGDAAPSGRLTQTFYGAQYAGEVSMFDMGMRPGPSAWPPGTNPGRTYRFYTGTPVFPFGFGLSTTTFVVSTPAGPAALPAAPVEAYLAAHGAHGAAFAPAAAAPLLASYAVNVTNTGTRDADYVALGFLIPPGAGTGGVPLQDLFGFARVHVPAGQTVTVWLGLSARDLTLVVPAAAPPGGALQVARVVARGTWTLRVGVEGPGVDARAEVARVQVEVA